MSALHPCAEKLLAQYPADFRQKAVQAVEGGKAFCPACHFAGHMNCGYFDECAEFIGPNGKRDLGRRMATKDVT